MNNFSSSLLILLEICFYCYGIQLQRSGYPKFPPPELSCGRRVTYWRPNRDPKVIGGEETPSGAAPWLVALQYNNKHRCGAVLLSRRALLTAAHCYIENMTAVAGINDHYENEVYKQVVNVEAGYLHEDYQKLGPYSHDIALLMLEDPGFKLNERIKPICLSKSVPNPGTWCEVTGWGIHDPGDSNPSNVLQSAAVPILSLDTCRKRSVYGGRYQTILDSMLCAGHLKGGIDACGGDSGSPLICEMHGRYELAGLVSWGEGCARRNRPGVYTNVASFLDWIRDTAEEHMFASEL